MISKVSAGCFLKTTPITEGAVIEEKVIPFMGDKSKEGDT